MPIPKCAATEVYYKTGKKCVEVGSKEYQDIVNKQPTTFSMYAKKIEKILKTKKVPVKKPSPLPLKLDSCPPDKVFSKLTKRCVKIGGQGYKQALKNDPTTFNNQRNKLVTWLKVPQPGKKPSPLPLKLDSCPPDKVFSKITRRCVKIGGQGYKQALKKDPTIFNNQKNKVVSWLKVPQSGKTATPKKPSPKPVTPKKPSPPVIKSIASMKNELTKPYINVVASKAIKELFMKKAKKILRTKNSKEIDSLKYTNNTKIPDKVFIKRLTDIQIYYYEYFPYAGSDTRISKVVFKKDKNLNRQVFNISYPSDNISTRFYKYILKNELNPDIIDIEWYLETQKYIANLTDRQRYALYAYTYHGDVYVNMLERGSTTLDYSRIDPVTIFYEFVVYMSDSTNSKFISAKGYEPGSAITELFEMHNIRYRLALSDPTGEKMMALFDIFKSGVIKSMKPSILLKLIKNLADTISSVIKNSPQTKKPMVVFRGVRDSFFTPNDYEKSHKKDLVYHNKGFVSTTLAYRVAINTFTKWQSGCCFKVITVLPGTRCIPLFGVSKFTQESEILFDRNVKYIIRDKYTAKIPKRVKSYLANDPGYIQMKISDIIIG